MVVDRTEVAEAVGNAPEAGKADQVPPVRDAVRVAR